MTTPQMDWLDDQRRKRAVSSDDIVRRMELMDVPLGSYDEQTLCDAVAEIVRLRAEVERLRAENAERAQGWRAERALADQLASHLEWALRCVGSLPLEMRTTFDARMAEVLAAHKEASREQ